MTKPKPVGIEIIGRRSRFTLTIAILLGVAVSVFLQRQPRPATVVSRTPVIDAVLTDAGSPRVGAVAPDVTIVVFTDYQCPVCKATDPALERLIAKDPRVRVIFKDWPIFGPASEAAARAAIAADGQGKYLAFHRALMSARVKLDDEQIRRIAVVSGVDWVRLERDSQSRHLEIKQQLARHKMQAWSLGLQGTPGYLVGPYLIEGGLDERHLAQAVKRARAAGPL